MTFPAEPFRIKAVETVAILDRTERERKLAEAGYNTFLLSSKDAYFDLLTDSGTSSISARQWANMMFRDHVDSGKDQACPLEQTIRELYGFKHIIATQKSRSAESLLSMLTIEHGQRVLGNTCSASHRFHIENQGGGFVDVIAEEAYQTELNIPFKGNIDLDKLAQQIEDHGADNIAYIRLSATVNGVGGQAVSLENIRAVSQIAKQNQILLFVEATHCVENAFFIQEQELGYAEMPIEQIVLEMLSYADGCVINGSNKECMVSSGGILCFNDEALFYEASDLIMLYSGMPTSIDQDTQAMLQGMRKAIATGFRDSIRHDYIEHRVKQVRYLGEKLKSAGVPIVEPVGGHAVFLDAKRYCQHLSLEQLPAQSLAASLYLHTGIRAMERGVVSAGKPEEHTLETVRLTIPRRVYTYSHMDEIAERVADHYQNREQIQGLVFSYEPKWLRFFNARFEPI